MWVGLFRRRTFPYGVREPRGEAAIVSRARGRNGSLLYTIVRSDNPYARVWPVVPVAREPRPSVAGASGPGVRVPAFQKDNLWMRERVQ